MRAAQQSITARRPHPETRTWPGAPRAAHVKHRECTSPPMTLRQASQTHAATCASAHEGNQWRISCLRIGSCGAPLTAAPAHAEQQLAYRCGASPLSK